MKKVENITKVKKSNTNIIIICLACLFVLKSYWLTSFRLNSLSQVLFTSGKVNPILQGVHRFLMTFQLTFNAAENSAQDSYNLRVLVEFGHIRYQISYCPLYERKMLNICCSLEQVTCTPA